VAKAGVWYLLAREGEATKTFRVSRGAEVSDTGTPVTRPRGFDLDQAWAAARAAWGAERIACRVRIRADPAFVPIRRGTVAGIEPDPNARPDSSGWATFTARFATPPAAGGVLAGFGAAVDVVEPEAVRTVLGQLGAELTGRYGTRGVP